LSDFVIFFRLKNKKWQWHKVAVAVAVAVAYKVAKWQGGSGRIAVAVCKFTKLNFSQNYKTPFFFLPK
jgi:hypothetical protein